jgi:2-polyprenyl-3-methyl-5-hydroxy-6-metoxy-1,4-benzoquinol methylase
MSASTLSTPNGNIELEPSRSGRTRITLRPTRKSTLQFIPRSSCETSHPEEVPLFLEHGISFNWLCEAISRIEDPDYVLQAIQRQLFAFAFPQEFVGARVLDFGSGIGASTLGMAELLPSSQITGLELHANLVGLGRHLAANRHLSNVEFEVSPAADAVPRSARPFDYIMLSAVFEHLLPEERRRLMPQLWDLLKPNGVLFVNQTPHRWFPRDCHSTGLWGINYLPDRLAHRYAHHSAMSPDINQSPDWNVHLRGGLRGGSERELIKLLTTGDRAPAFIMQPIAQGLRDRADYWLSFTSARYHSLKAGIAWFFRITDYLFATVPAVNLDVAVRKGSKSGHGEQ